MNVFDTYTYQLLCELNNLKVEYLVVGEYAVNYHGYIVDIENLQKIQELKKNK